MIIALGRVSPSQWWIVLEDVAQHTDLALHQVAEQILTGGRSGDVPAHIRAAPESAPDQQGPTQILGRPPDALNVQQAAAWSAPPTAATGRGPRSRTHLAGS
ncbi:hypothetical protein [Streptomyces griseorubiginosus]|uniref:hypothetical protein n=1 Tax=Streptomyces griseorubiginosus TaxID=67304 RepID=UPI0033E5E282